MLTQLRLSLGGGRAALHLDVGRAAGPSSHRRLGQLTLLLVLPIVLVLGAQALGLLSGWYSLDTLMHAPGPPWVDVLGGAALSALIAMVVLIAVRLRVVAARADGSWTVSVTLRLTALEALALAIAVGLVGLFIAHLFADGLACVRGVKSAC